MMIETLLREDSDGLCTLTLNRPEKHNALDTGLFERLDAECAALEQQHAAIGCVVLRASGRSFCAGADLAAMASGSAAAPRFKPGVIERLARLPQVVIACVHGICVTGGLELALAADFIIASNSARFADTHGRWGLVAGWGMTQRLPRRVGPSFARLMMMTGRFIDAAEALRVGLIDICAPDEELGGQVTALAREVLANSWFTNRESKRLLLETDGLPLAAGLAHEHYRHPGSAPDYKERIALFARRSSDS